MEVLHIVGDDDIPEVTFDKSKELFEISGRSVPEDVIQFYKPILKWLDEYSSDPLEKTVFNFKMEYYNTASSKLLLDILFKLEDIYKSGHQVLVRWYYPQNDGDIEDGGKDYFDLVKVPHEIIANIPVTVSENDAEDIVLQPSVEEQKSNNSEQPSTKVEEPQKKLYCPFCGSEKFEKVVSSNNSFADKIAGMFKSIIGSKDNTPESQEYKCLLCEKTFRE